MLKSLRRLSPVKSYFHFRLHGRHLEFRQRTTSDNVRGDTVKLGMVDNVGIAVGIAAPSLVVQKVFPLPVSAGRHLEFWWSTIVYQRRSTSDSVPSEIASKFPSVQKLFPVPVWWPPS